MLLSQKRKYLLFAFLIFFGCKVEEKNECYDVDRRIDLYESCSFSLELDCDRTFIRTNISGQCSQMSILNYAKALDSILISDKLNNRTCPQLQYLYLNTYEMGDVYDIIKLLNESKVWKDSCQDLSGENVDDECFRQFNQEANYMKEIESVVHKHFGGSYKLTFSGIGCISKDSILEMRQFKGFEFKKDCYPLSFGLATFEFKSKE